MSDSTHEQLDLAAGYVLGALSDDERRLFERHLAAGCPECEKAIAEWSDTTVLLAATAPPAMPSGDLKTRVLAAARELPQDGRVDAPRATEPRRVIELPARKPFGLGTWMWAAAAAALAIATGLSWTTTNRLRSELAANRQELTRLEGRLVEEQRRAEVLLAPDARVAELAITPAGVAELRARATFDPKTRSAVIVFDHFQPPTGRDYELWALQGDGVASLGVIEVDEAGHAVVRLENVGDPATLGGFAVSLEPKGGSPSKTAPSGPVVMAGKFGG